MAKRYVGEMRRLKSKTTLANENPLENSYPVRQDPTRVRNGLTKCIYLSNRADVIVKALGMRFRRSDSAIVSLVMEKYGRSLLKNKDARV
jgi:hypothetical protein